MDGSEMEGMDGSEMEGSEMEDMDMEESSFVFGEPADESEADRTITIQALDELAFDPPTVEVSAGEVITFEVENAGVLPHDFTLGDEEVQEEHAEEIAEMDGEEMEHAEPNTMTVPAGETSSLTWKFADAGEILYGCHQPGHYDAGMVGTLTITS